MKRKTFRCTVSALAVFAFVAAEGVSACDIPFQKVQMSFGPAGQMALGGNLGFADGSTVIAGDVSYQLNSKWQFRGGLGVCRFGSTEIIYGFKFDTEVFRSEDGEIGVFAGGSASRVSYGMTSSITAPVTGYVTKVMSPEATAFGGVSLTLTRTSSGSFSGSDTNLGLQGGVIYQLTEAVQVVGGGDFQDYEFGSSFRFQTGFSVTR